MRLSLTVSKHSLAYQSVDSDMRSNYYSATLYGALAQLGERFAGSEQVSGSIPLGSTIQSS